MKTSDLHIEIKSSDETYVIDLSHKITILAGMSGSGKTTLYRCIQVGYPAVTIECRLPVYVIGDMSPALLDTALTTEDAVYFIDEDNTAIRNLHVLENISPHIQGYVVVITRDSSIALTYSVDAVRYLEEQNNGVITLVSKQLYPTKYIPNKSLGVIVEGQNGKSEHTFYSEHCNYPVIGSGGKDNILTELLKNRNYVALPDREAFGSNMHTFYNYAVEFGLAYWMPISFEQLLYSAWSSDTSEPERSDYWEFTSLEKYYTTKLAEYANKNHTNYSKSRLPACIHDPSVVDNFKKLFPDELQYLFKEDKLQWCRDNAPDSLKDLSDSELLEIMDSAWRHRDD